MITASGHWATRLVRPALLLIVFAAPPAPAAGDEPRFDIWEYQVTGNSRLDTRDIEQAVYPFLGPGRTLSDVQQARAGIEKLYRDSGFGAAVVSIPEQDVAEGLVRLEVLEGRVERVIVSGARYFSPERIRAAAPSLGVGEVLNLPDVQDDIVRLNKVSRDRRITPVLRPGSARGLTEVDLKVDDRLPVHGSLEINNRYTRDTSETRLDATLSYDNLWQREHSLLLGYQTSPQDRDDVEVVFGTYLARMFRSEWLTSGYYIKSNSDVASAGTVGVVGKGDIAGLLFIRPLGTFGSAYHTATFGLDYKDFGETVALIGSDTGVDTPINYWTTSVMYDLTLSGANRSTDFGIDLVYAPRFLGNEQREFDSKRSGSQANFAYVGFSLSHRQDLRAGMRAQLRGSVQFSDSPLISNEQFSFGGADSVRGYLQSQQFVDDGYSGQFEFVSPNFGKAAWDRLSGRLFAFVDVGGGSIRKPLPEQRRSFFLWSAGIGLRLAVREAFTADLDWAWPFRDTGDGGVETDDMGSVIGVTPPSIESGDDRWHFRVRLGF